MKPKALTLILLVTGAMSYSQQPERTFLDRVSGFQEIGRIARKGVEFGRPKFSPDGRWIAFTSVSAEHALWIASLSDLKPMPLVKREDLAEISQYNWSPDSQQIAYVDGRMLKLINVRTQAVTSYNTVSPFMSDPVFDAEGGLAFVGNTNLMGNPAALKGDLDMIKRMTPKDSPYLNLVDKGGKLRVVRDAHRLAGSNIVVPYILSPSGEVYLTINGEDRRITPIQRRSQLTMACLRVSLSQDRNKVAIECVGENLFVYQIGSGEIYTVGAGVVGMSPCWSPDSEWVLFLVSIDDGHVVFATDLYISHYTGGKAIKVARGKGPVHGASWGKKDLIAYDQQGQIIIGRITHK